MSHRMQVIGELEPGFDEILTPEALTFLTRLHDAHDRCRRERLAGRELFHTALENGRELRFLEHTRWIREDEDWRVAGAGPGLEDRRVEITGPTDRKMTINALNSGAKVWLADHEDATSPTWHNVIDGQRNLRDAIHGDISFTSPEGKQYRVTPEERPTIVFRPRGWHLEEAHLRYIDGCGDEQAASASLVDAGLYAFHNARALIAGGTGPYFYLPKIENHAEARLWDQVFSTMEEELGLRRGTIRATVLIETITAAFEMEEILYELRDHAAGLNAGRWDYIFSIIKNFRGRGEEYVLPDRADVTMTVPFMRAYTELLVQTCHKRGAHAIGGMSAFIPNSRRPEVTERALEKVAADKRREAGDGFDGSWVAHPGLVATARAEFDAALGQRPNQLERQRDDVRVTAEQLLDLRTDGRVTAAGVRANVSVGLRYLEAWLRGSGAAAIDDLMEDVATAEISRSQLWQWMRYGIRTAEGERITPAYVEGVLDEVLGELDRTDGDRFDDAEELFREVALGERFPLFLTLPGTERYLEREPAQLARAS
ncbi:MAG: malate synthase A [Actinomycetales bacterium]|nr:malate synthase A [Actinomycetales bacterium]